MSGLKSSSLLGWALLLLGLGVLLWALSDMVLLVFAALLLAVLLRGAASRLTVLIRMPINFSLMLVIALAVGLVGGFAWLFGPRFVNEGQQLIKAVQHYVSQLQAQHSNNMLVQALRQIGAGKGQFNLGPLAPKLLTVTFGTVGGLFLLIVTTLYFAISPSIYINGLLALVPAPGRQRARDILQELGRTLRFWMLGQLIDMAVVGVLSTLGLAMLGIPLPLALGVLAGVLTFVPYLGAILAGVPAVIVASTLGSSYSLWVVLLYTGCHVIEGYLVAPLVARRMVDLPPAVTVLSMALLGELYGVLGILVAAPLAASVLLLIRELYVHDRLGVP